MLPWQWKSVYYLYKQQREWRMEMSPVRCLLFLFVFIIISTPLECYESCFQSLSVVNVIKAMFQYHLSDSIKPVTHWGRRIMKCCSLSASQILVQINWKFVWLAETLLLGYICLKWDALSQQMSLKRTVNSKYLAFVSE